ncbi:pol, partial [Symbiodinium natans]
EQHAQRSQLTMNKTGKRSYQRACKVALAKGAALYKGRLLTAQALGAHEDQFAVSEKPEKQSFQPIRQYHHKFEIEVLSWNAGSITSRVWNELLAILATPEYQNIKLVLLQESHWQQDQTYSSGPWSVLTCGSESRHKAGLVVLVHRSVAQLSEIRSTTIIPGHLQHVMIPWQRSRIHLLNLYQHVWDSKLSKLDNRRRRKDVLSQLETRLRRVPLRDFMLVAGDFNSHAVTERPFIGPSVPRRARFANADVRSLPELCRSCGLTALNTWASSHKSTYANSDGTYESQIDFLLVRLQDARRRSKEASSDKNFPVAAYRDGSKHFPVRAKLFVPPYSPPPSKPKPFDATALDASFRRKDEDWQAYSKHLTAEVVKSVAEQNSWQSIDRTMVRVTAEQFPPPRKAQPVAGPIQQAYWTKVRQIQEHKRSGNGQSPECQQLISDIKTEAQSFKKLQKQRKLEKQERLLLQAQEDKRQQSHKLSQALRKLAPWKPAQRVNLRDSAGEPLDAKASASAMREYSSHIFSKGSPLDPVAARPREAVNASQVAEQIKTIPVGKAVPSMSAPVSAWKSLAPEAHVKIADLINTEVSQSDISPYLKDPRIAWIPKPGKPATAMKNLRPIGVISVPGKVIAGAVKTRIAPALQERSQLEPQFAYIRKRGVRDAIAKACQHLDLVQEMRQEHRRDMHKAQQGQRRMEKKWGPGSSQARDILTVFADDFLHQETFTSFAELQQVLTRLEALFQSLEEVGLEVNPAKSKALLMVQGTQQSLFRKQYTKRLKNQLHLVLPSGHQIPIHHQLTYLGVQLSYGAYKDQTVDYRISQAQGKFELLRSILCTTKALDEAKKLEIWRVYVESSLLHGIVSTGITHTGLQKLQSKYSRMLRSIFQQHQHFSRMETTELFEHHKIQTPQEVLLRQMRNYQDAMDAAKPTGNLQTIQEYLGLRSRLISQQQLLQSMQLALAEEDHAERRAQPCCSNQVFRIN